MRLTAKSCSIAATLLLSLLTQGRLGATASVVSATPSSGIGFTRTFALVYSDTSYASLTNVQVNFSSPLSSAGACYLAYVPAGNYISLVNDAGTAFGAGVTLGSSGTAQNSQCSVSAATSTHSGSGTNLTVNLAITFSSSFTGTKTIYMNASDSSGGTNWLPEGTWTVGTPSVPPSNVSVAPSSGTGLSQTFTFVYSDTYGYTNLSYVEMNFSSPESGPNACGLGYFPAGNYLSIVNDAGNSWSSGATPGSSGTLQNSQCSVNVATSSASGSGNNLTVTLAITFSPSFVGAKGTYMLAVDNYGLLSEWQAEGSWTVPSVTSNVSVAPSSGTGLSQTFTMVYSDTGGYQNLNYAQVLFSSTLNGFNACYVSYFASGNVISLDGDNNTWSNGATLGSGVTLQNSQCSVNAAMSSVSGSGNNLTLNLAITFFSSFAGAKNTWLIAGDNDGIVSQWQMEGAWMVGSPQPADFTITTNSLLDPLLISPGGTNSMIVAVSPAGTFTDTVNLGVTNLPLGSSWQWVNSFISNGSGSAKLYITVPQTAPNGTITPSGKYLVTVTGIGSSTGITHIAQFTIEVNGVPAFFTMLANPNFESTTVGGSASYNVTVTSQAGFSGAVALTMSGQPLGSNVGCNPSCTITPPISGSASAILTITVLGSGAKTYPLTITGIASGWRQDLPATLVVNPATGQTLSVSPTSVSLGPGQAQQFTASIGGSNAPVRWGLSSPGGAVGGTISQTGPNSAVYYAPLTVAGNQTIVVTATSQADGVTQGGALIAQLAAAAPATIYAYNDGATYPYSGGTCSQGVNCNTMSCSLSAPDSSVTVSTANMTTSSMWGLTVQAHTNAAPGIGTRTINCSATGGGFTYLAPPITLSVYDVNTPVKLIQFGWAGNQELWTAMTFASNGDSVIGPIVWQDPNGDGNVTSEPVALTAGSSPYLSNIVLTTDPAINFFAELSIVVSSINSDGSTSAGDFAFNPLEFNFVNGRATIPNLNLSSYPFPGLINSAQYQFQWSIRYNAGAPFQPFRMPTTHTIYKMHGPINNTPSTFRITTRRLDYVTGQAQGLSASDLGGIISNLTDNLLAQPFTFDGSKNVSPANADNVWAVVDNPSPLDCFSLSGIAAAELQQLGFGTANADKAFATGAVPPGDTDATSQEVNPSDPTYFLSFQGNFYEGFIYLNPPDTTQPMSATVAPASTGPNGPLLGLTDCPVTPATSDNEIKFRVLTSTYALYPPPITFLTWVNAAGDELPGQIPLPTSNCQ